MYILAQSNEVFSQAAHAFDYLGVALDAAGVDRQPGQPLREVVVQFSREVPPLIFVRGDQTACKLLDLAMACLERSAALATQVFRLLAFGDVDVTANVAGKTAVRRIFRNTRAEQPSKDAVGTTH